MNESETRVAADPELTQRRSRPVPESSISKRARELMECVAQMQGWTYVPPDQRTRSLTPLERDLAREEAHPEHTVYFLYGAGRIKIGFTTGDPRKREDQIGNVCPVPISLVKTVPGGKVTEFRLHHQFRADRMYGEWFELSKELRAFIGETGALVSAEREYREWLRKEEKAHAEV